MYSSFQAGAIDQKPIVNKTVRASKHPGGTAHACLECRRRKSRCDGARPCTRCREGQKEHLCIYVSQKPRIVPSQKALEQLSNSLQECRKILDCMFPATDVAALQPLSRQELIDLASSSTTPDGITEPLRRTMSTATARSSSLQQAPDRTDASMVLEQLNEAPSEYDEEAPDFVTDDVTDDVNALSLSSSRQSSYVGSSSVAIAFKVIAVLCPGIMKHSSLTAPTSPFTKSEKGASLLSIMNIPRETEVAYVNSYFDHFHPLVPMVNEQLFRIKLNAGRVEDPAWGALMNMVLAMGSIARETCLETMHSVFYQRAKALLSFDSFGSGKIEIVQALTLMGGLYLHYVNRPNMAVAVTGSALRMAYALGLHRKHPSETLGNQAPDRDPKSDRETKRRTWWCLVCVDTWGSTTLGRPSMGDCFGPAISISAPSFEDFPEYPLEERAPILVAATKFCSVSAQIQDQLATSPCLTLGDAKAYDSQLEAQFLQFPPLLRSPNRCPANILVPRAVMKWQNQNLRLLLHRPTLLAAALSRRPFEDLALPEQESIDRCRDVAGESIVDIACESQPDPVCAWHAAWYLFQAAMVPLVSLFYEHNNIRACSRWHSQVEMALRLLQSMELWAPMAKKARQVLSELHESSYQISAETLAESTQLWDPQSSYLFDEIWMNPMWYNVENWPNIPVQTTNVYSDLQAETNVYNNGNTQALPYPHGLHGLAQNNQFANGVAQDDYTTVSRQSTMDHYPQRT